MSVTLRTSVTSCRAARSQRRRTSNATAERRWPMCGGACTVARTGRCRPCPARAARSHAPSGSRCRRGAGSPGKATGGARARRPTSGPANDGSCVARHVGCITGTQARGRGCVDAADGQGRHRPQQGRAGRARGRSSSPTPARARRWWRCRPAGSATPTCTTARAASTTTSRSCSATRPPGSSRRSATGVTDVAPGDFVILNWRAVCGQLPGVPPRASPGTASTRTTRRRR